MQNSLLSFTLGYKMFFIQITFAKANILPILSQKYIYFLMTPYFLFFQLKEHFFGKQLYKIEFAHAIVFFRDTSLISIKLKGLYCKKKFENSCFCSILNFQSQYRHHKLLRKYRIDPTLYFVNHGRIQFINKIFFGFVV